MAANALRYLQRTLRRSSSISCASLQSGLLPGSEVPSRSSHRESAASLPSVWQPASRTSVAAYSSGRSPAFEANDVDSYNYLISQVNYRKRHFLARDVYEDMLMDGVQPIRDTFYLLITGCMQGARLQDVMYFFDEMKAMGITPDVSMYNSIIAACGRSQQIDRAFQVAEEMEAFGIQPKHRTFLALLRACALVGRVEETYGVVRKMAANGFTLDKYCYSALITAHKNKTPQNEETVQKIFELLEQSKTPSAEDDMAVAAAGEAEPGEDIDDGFLNFLNTDEVLLRRGFINRHLTVYHAAVSAFQDLGNREAVKKVLQMIEQDGHGIDAYSAVQLIKCYIVGGDFERACLEYNKFLELGRRPTLDLYLTLIDGALTHTSPANSAVAQKLLIELVEKGFYVNSKVGGDLMNKACQDKIKDLGTANMIWDMMQDRQVRLPMKIIMDYYKALDKSGTPKDDPRMVALRTVLEDNRRPVRGPAAGDLPFRARWGEIGFLVPLLLLVTTIFECTQADPLTVVDLSALETRVLRLGYERKQDKLPLRGGGGRCVYELMDLKESFSYEVKISYPASIPSSFTLSLAKEGVVSNVHRSRRLFNTDKIIFEVGRENALQVTGDETSFRVLVLVTVEPEGIVAKAHFQEQEFVIYNIMLEEVRLGGVPVQALWVGSLGLMAIAGSLLVAQFFPSWLETEQEKYRASKQAIC